MNSSSDWDGTFKLPEIENISESDKNIGLAIKVGADVELNFDKSVKITLPGQASKEKVAFKRGGVYTEIDRCTLSDGGVVQEPAVGGACYYGKSNGDVIILTYHFTTFLAYDEVVTSVPPSSTSSSGGGGGTRTVYVEVNTTSEEPINEVIVSEEKTENLEGNLETVEEDEPELVEEEKQSRSFITGFVVGVREGKVGNIFVLIFILGILGLVIYYNYFTISGLSKRAENFHRRADNLNRLGKYEGSLNLRRRARKIQERVDRKKY